MTDTVHPEVLWAQRSSKTDDSRNVIYLTIGAPDVPKADTKLDIQPTKITFQGKSTTKNVTYKAELELFEEIDPKESKVNHTDRDIEFVLRKKNIKEEFWPRLLKEKAKVHWLKTDFDKWVDEDEQDAKDDDDMSNPAAGGGGFPGMEGMGGMGGMGGAGGGFEGIDFSKFGAGPGGMGGMEGLGGDMSDDEDLPEDDEEMPPLEGEEKPAAEKKSVIEELE